MTGKDRVSPFCRSFRTIFDIGAVADLTDGELLDRFATRQGESAELAFAALLERHGPMVLRVCRKVLGETRDPLDAFQATFLVLVRRVRSVRKADSIASWLHGVAYRVALAERTAEARRRKYERLALVATDRGEPQDLDDLGALLHQELDRLPDRLRAPLILCHLEGMTHEQAADRLGLPVGTVKSRMARGRDRLKVRLSRQGFKSSSYGIAWGECGLSRWNSLSGLLDATARAATKLADGQPIAGMVPASAVALMQGVLKTMTLNPIKLSMAGLLAIGILATAANVLAQKPEPQLQPTSKLEVVAGIAYETSFVDMTGFGWREEFHEKLKVVAQKGSMTVWAVDPETLKLILTRSKGTVQSPKVTAFKDVKALVERQNQMIPILNQQMILIPLPQNVVEGKLPDDAEPFRVRSGDRQASEAFYRSKGINNFISDGIKVELAGHRVDNGVLVQGHLESQIIVSIAQLDATRAKTDNGDKVAPNRVVMQVPETIEARIEGEWLVPAEGVLLVGMGVHRFPTRWGMSEVRERLVAIKASELPISLLPDANKHQTIPEQLNPKAN